ncbi:MAG: hypothetical protein OEY97_06780 [Nitrospirota bacterium]|nr:hypothetical protein [Nitrospirota bacterium]
MKLTDLSILEVRILKHLYCQNPNRNYADPEARFGYENGLEMTSADGMKLRLYLISIKTGSDLHRRINPGVCIPGGTYRFIGSQLKAPKLDPETCTEMPESFKRSYHDSLRNLIARGLVIGFIAGYTIAEGEDGFRSPVPARVEHAADGCKVVGVSLTEAGFAAARELFLQLAEQGD